MTTPNGNAEGRAISRALRSLVRKARDAGCKNPTIFFEPEAMTFYVMDGDHPNEIDDERCHAGQRQEAIVLRAGLLGVGVPVDAGSW